MQYQSIEEFGKYQRYIDYLEQNRNRIVKKKIPSALISYIYEQYSCKEVDLHVKKTIECKLLFPGNIDYYRKARGYTETAYDSFVVEVLDNMYTTDAFDDPELNGKVYIAIDTLTGYVSSNSVILGQEMILAKGLSKEDCLLDQVTYAYAMMCIDHEMQSQ